MNRSYTLLDIEEKTGAPVDRLRYVIDSGILPGGRNQKRTKSRGVARRFTGFEAFCIAMAVFMLDVGVKRRTVEWSFILMTKYAGGTRNIGSTVLFQAYSCQGIVGLEIGDRQNIRLVASGSDSSAQEKLRWIQVETQAELGKYEPQITIRINLSKLRDSLPAS